MPKEPRSNRKAKALAKTLPPGPSKHLGVTAPPKNGKRAAKHKYSRPLPRPEPAEHTPAAIKAANKEVKKAEAAGEAGKNLKTVPPGDGLAQPIGPVEPNPKPVTAPPASAAVAKGIHGNIAAHPHGDPGNPVGPGQAEAKPAHRTRRVATAADAVKTTTKGVSQAAADAQKLAEEEAGDKAALNHEIHANRQKAHDARSELPLPQDDSNPRPEALPGLKVEIAKTVAILNAASDPDLPRETLLAMRGEPQGSPLEDGRKKPEPPVKVTPKDFSEADASTAARDGRVQNTPAVSGEAVELKGKGPWIFVKNQIIETVILPDGKEFQFTKSRISVSDPELAKSLLTVSKRHNILFIEK